MLSRTMPSLPQLPPASALLALSDGQGLMVLDVDGEEVLLSAAPVSPPTEDADMDS